MATSSASIRRTAAASCSLIIRGQSFSILVSSASIAARSGVGSGVAILIVLVFVFCGLAQPNWENARRAVATARTTTEKYLFMTRYSFWEQIENRFFYFGNHN